MARTKQFDKTVILEKAMELFWKKGFHATSIQDLVAHLGINRASMYSTFGSKEQLFKDALHLYRDKGSINQNRVDEVLSDTTARSFLETFLQQQVRETLEDCDRKGCFVVNTTTEMANLSQDIQLEMNNNMEGTIATFAYILEIGLRRGEITGKAQVDTLARHLYIFLSGIKVIAMVEQSYGNLCEAIKQEMNLIFGA